MFIGARPRLDYRDLPQAAWLSPTIRMATACSFESVRGPASDDPGDPDRIPSPASNSSKRRTVAPCKSLFEISLPKTPLLLLGMSITAAISTFPDRSNNCMRNSPKNAARRISPGTTPAGRSAKALHAPHDPIGRFQARAPAPGWCHRRLRADLAACDCVTETEAELEAPQAAVADRRPCRRRHFTARFYGDGDDATRGAREEFCIAG